MKCDVCKIEPAVYGDGSTWARCSKCEYEHRKGLEGQEEQEGLEKKETTGEGIPHQRIKDLVSIVMPVYIINYPLFHYTGNAIGSVRSHTKRLIEGRQQYELVVVDNGSPIKPPNNHSWYADKLITNENNLGVTKAWNQGIRMSFGEYVVLINNDVQVYEHWLEDMKKCLDEGGLDLVMAYPMYSNTEPFARWVEAEKIRDRWSNKPIQESFSDFTDFSCVMFKKDLFEKLGDDYMFDERFVSYASDVDLRKRMDNAGLKYASCKAVPIHHIIDATGASIPETPEIMNKDKEEFRKKWEGLEEKEGIEGGEIKMDLAQLSDQELDYLLTAIPEEQEKRKVQPKQRDDLVRTDATGDRIYLVKDGQTHWIKNPDVLAALGASFGQEKTLPREEFNKFIKGEDISLENVEKYKPSLRSGDLK